MTISNKTLAMTCYQDQNTFNNKINNIRLTGLYSIES